MMKIESCKELFPTNKILTFPSIYIYECILCVVTNNLIQNVINHTITKQKTYKFCSTKHTVI